MLGADPDTFRPLALSPWAIDKHDAYRADVPIHAEEPSTFVPINFNWAKDSKAYYAIDGIRADERKVDCDYGSMVVLNASYAKDKSRCYWLGWPIEGADLATFRVVDQNFAEDKAGRFVGASRLKGN